MKLAVVIYSNDAETVWNAFRFANFSLKEGDTAKVFLLAKGVEYEKLDSEKFNIKEQAKSFLNTGGKLTHSRNTLTPCAGVQQRKLQAIAFCFRIFSSSLKELIPQLRDPGRYSQD